MIETGRLRLINFTDEHAGELLKGDKFFSDALGIKLPEDWTEEKLAIETFYSDMKKTNSDSKWWTYLIISKSGNKLIGCGGYKGEPTDGTVEIGYEIHKDYRGQGLASEAAQALIDFAFTHPEVKKVLAHTLAEDNSSCAVLRKLKFDFIKQLTDPDDGEIWQWEYPRKMD